MGREPKIGGIHAKIGTESGIGGIHAMMGTEPRMSGINATMSIGGIQARMSTSSKSKESTVKWVQNLK